jgi:hypothetical protein
MKSIVKIIQQRVIHYGDLNDLKRANDVDSFKSYSSFVGKFAFTKNAKEKEISNSIDVKIENFDDVVKENDNNQEIRHTT